MDSKEYWKRLLTSDRLGKETSSGITIATDRSDFERDYGRIIFSSSFRRLQDKTQVFPLAESDFTRNRLTHTLEVASVGRSIGIRIGKRLRDLELLPIDREPEDIGSIVSAACLAHDTGNPPFGHSGESAIQSWASNFFKSKSDLELTLREKKDFQRFEGNAQSLRLYARLQSRDRQGGLRLTLPVLGTILKYPLSSDIDSDLPKEDKPHQFSKWGFFQDDKEIAKEIFDGLGISSSENEKYIRHPLVYLMEADDDICYALADLEDAYRLKLFSFKETFDLIVGVIQHKDTSSDESSQDINQLNYGYPDNPKYFPSNHISIIKSRAIGDLIEMCCDVFIDNLENIEKGKFNTDLISQTPVYLSGYKLLKSEVGRVAYNDDRVLKIEYAGYKAIGGLLDMFADAIVLSPKHASSKKLQGILPSEVFFTDAISYDEVLKIESSRSKREEWMSKLSDYKKLISITDYVSGMTDSYAVDMFQYLNGIKLP